MPAAGTDSRTRFCLRVFLAVLVLAVTASLAAWYVGGIADEHLWRAEENLARGQFAEARAELDAAPTALADFLTTLSVVASAGCVLAVGAIVYFWHEERQPRAIASREE